MIPGGATGSTGDSGSFDGGSSPSPVANMREYFCPHCIGIRTHQCNMTSTQQTQVTMLVCEGCQTATTIQVPILEDKPDASPYS